MIEWLCQLCMVVRERSTALRIGTHSGFLGAVPKPRNDSSTIILITDEFMHTC